MNRGCRFKFHFCRSSLTFGRPLPLQRLTARIEKLLNSYHLSPIFLVAAAAITRCQTHLHLGINAAWELRVGMQVIHAAPHFEEVESIVHKLLCRHSRGERPVVNILSRSSRI